MGLFLSNLLIQVCENLIAQKPFIYGICLVSLEFFLKIASDSESHDIMNGSI